MNALVKTICTFVTSSIGRKIIVALTGLCLVLFLAGHLAGNLLIFGGPEWINTYAHGLHSMPEAALWGIRAGLAVIFIIHVWLTIQLKLENHAAREPYVFKNTIKATLSSRYMIYTGLTVLVFLIYHLYQYTLRVGYDPAQFTTFISDGTVETFDVYKMIVTGFSNVWCSAFCATGYSPSSRLWASIPAKSGPSTTLSPSPTARLSAWASSPCRSRFFWVSSNNHQLLSKS